MNDSTAVAATITRSVPTLNWLEPGTGGPAGPGTVALHPLLDLLDAAAAAGFAGIGLDDLTVKAYLDDGNTIADVASAVRTRGLRCTDIGLLRISDDVATVTATAQWLAELATATGAAACITVLGAPSSDPAMLTGLRAAAAVLGPAGVRIALEFAPFSKLPTLEDTTPLCEQVGWDRCGVLLDSWHVFRGPTEWSAVEALRAEHLALVHFDDAPEPVSDDMMRETRYRRVAPGEGTFPLERFVNVLDAKGYTGAVSVEVLSSELRAASPVDGMQSLREAFDRAWPTS